MPNMEECKKKMMEAMSGDDHEMMMRKGQAVMKDCPDMEMPEHMKQMMMRAKRRGMMEYGE